MGDNATYQRKRSLRGQKPNGGPGSTMPQSRGSQDPDPPRRALRPANRGTGRLIGPNDR